MGEALNRVVLLVQVCHLVSHRVSVHPYEVRALVRRDRVRGVDRHRVLGACPVAGQKDYFLGVVRHRVVPDEESRFLPWPGTDCSQDEAQAVSGLASVPQVCWRLVLAHRACPQIWARPELLVPRSLAEPQVSASLLEGLEPPLEVSEPWVRAWARQAWILWPGRLAALLVEQPAAWPVVSERASWPLVLVYLPVQRQEILLSDASLRVVQ